MQHGLSPLAEEEIAALEADGIKLTAHDILHIAFLGEQVMSPQTRQELARGRPVPVGGTVLWPLTLAAADWWDRMEPQMESAWRLLGIKWPTLNKQLLALGYAMAHGNRPLPEDPREAARLVAEWRRTKLHCTLGELKEAIGAINAQSIAIESDATEEPATLGEISMMLSAMMGSPEVWEYQCAIGFVNDLLETIAAQSNADGKSLKDLKSIKATKALGLAVHRIRKRHQEEAHSG